MQAFGKDESRDRDLGAKFNSTNFELSRLRLSPTAATAYLLLTYIVACVFEHCKVTSLPNILIISSSEAISTFEEESKLHQCRGLNKADILRPTEG